MYKILTKVLSIIEELMKIIFNDLQIMEIILVLLVNEFK